MGNKVALVCIAKNEDNYIQEWVEYHKKLGFDTIFIYQNDWVCNLEDNSIVKIELNGECKQTVAYNNFIKEYHNQYEWAAFFDVDEFLVLKKHNNIKDFLSDYSSFNSIGVNWVVFGNNGLTEVNGEYSLLKRFTKRQKDINPHVKNIVKLLPNVVMDVHNPLGTWYDTQGNQHQGSFNHDGNIDIVQLNHYFCKTKEEYQLKIERGRADLSKSHPDWVRKWSDYDLGNTNEVEDLIAYDFFFNKIK
jgi:hypothetical protein